MSDNCEKRVVLGAAQATPRALEMSNRRFLTTTDHVELALLMEVLAGVRDNVSIDDAWLKVLEKHWYAPVPYDGPDLNEPYATYRVMAMTVLGRLEQLANGEEITEDTFELYPDNDQEAGVKRFLDSLLAQAATMVTFVYESPFVHDGNDLLQRLGHDARFALKSHFADQWFDDPYALGYSMMDNPGYGSSPFGAGGREQIAMMRSMAQAILDSLAVYNDEAIAEDVRMHYGHTVAFFWPMLKAALMYANEDMNSPARGLGPDDPVVDLIEQALLQGKAAHPGVIYGIKIRSTGRSRDSQRVVAATTADVLAAFRERVAYEYKLSLALGMIR